MIIAAFRLFKLTLAYLFALFFPALIYSAQTPFDALLFADRFPVHQNEDRVGVGARKDTYSHPRRSFRPIFEVNVIPFSIGNNLSRLDSNAVDDEFDLHISCLTHTRTFDMPVWLFVERLRCDDSSDRILFLRKTSKYFGGNPDGRPFRSAYFAITVSQLYLIHGKVDNMREAVAHITPPFFQGLHKFIETEISSELCVYARHAHTFVGHTRKVSFAAGPGAEACVQCVIPHVQLMH